jgi:hypothetical protein
MSKVPSTAAGSSPRAILTSLPPAGRIAFGPVPSPDTSGTGSSCVLGLLKAF